MSNSTGIVVFFFLKMAFRLVNRLDEIKNTKLKICLFPDIFLELFLHQPICAQWTSSSLPTEASSGLHIHFPAYILFMSSLHC